MGKAILILTLTKVSASAVGAQPPAEKSIRCELRPEVVNPRDSATYRAMAAKLNLTDGSLLVAQPRFQIVSEAGRVLASGQFEYG